MGITLTDDDFRTGAWVDKIDRDPTKLDDETKTICFHNLDGKGRPTSVNDARIYTYITRTQHLFICGKIPYIYRGGYYKADVNGSILPTMIRKCLLERYVRSPIITRIFNLFLHEEDLEREPWELNAHSAHYVNFKNGTYDALNRKLCPHDPKYLSTNQIPWDYDPNANHGSGTTFESYIGYAIPDADDREMLLEYIGLCCTIDTSQQKFLVLSGEGGTGKSTLIRVIERIVGRRNISNVELDKLNKDFHAIPLMGKLLNSCSDLKIRALDDVSKTKQLVGEDEISDAHKGKDVVSFNSYAKMLFSTNELPIKKKKKTGAFYRRLLVVTMDRKPAREDPFLKAKLMSEIPYIIDQAMLALQRMYQRGRILVSARSEARTQQLRIESDTIEAFIVECCDTSDPSVKCNRGDLYAMYNRYCQEWERQAHGRNAFFKALRSKGFPDAAVHGERMFRGIKFIGLPEDDVDFRLVKSGSNPFIA